MSVVVTAIRLCVGTSFDRRFEVDDNDVPLKPARLNTLWLTADLMVGINSISEDI